MLVVGYGLYRILFFCFVCESKVEDQRNPKLSASMAYFGTFLFGGWGVLAICI